MSGMSSVRRRVGTRSARSGRSGSAGIGRPSALVAGAVIAGSLVVGLAAPAYAVAPGSPDPSFGNGGSVVIDFGGVDLGADIAVDALGRSVIVGQANGATDTNVGVARVLPNGTLDPSFGTGGKSVIDLGRGDAAYSVLGLPGGGVLVGGGIFRNPGTSSSDFVLLRLTADGALDPTFGTAGVTMTDFGGNEQVNALALQSDGRIIAVGGAVVARYSASGQLDTTFGANGQAQLPTSHNIASMAVVADDSIVLAGGATNTSFAFRKLTANGVLDTTFGTNGTAIPTNLAGASVASVAVHGTKILAVGYYSASGFNIDALTVRLNANGSLDTTFHTTGVVTTNLGVADYMSDIAVQDDEKIVVAGGVVGFATSTADVGAIRLNTDGSLDTSFGTNGTSVFNLGRLEFPEKFVLAPAGTLTMASTSTGSPGRQDADFQIVQISTAAMAPTIPAAPLGITATAAGADVHVAWTDASKDEAGFDIERARYNASTGVWGEWVSWPLSANATTFTDAAVPDGQYAYLVRSYNDAGPSAWAITTLIVSHATGLPAPPSALDVHSNGHDVVVSWADDATDELGYDIMRARWVAGVWSEWTAWAGDINQHTFTDSGVSDGFYAYLVRTHNGFGVSAWTIGVIEHTTASGPPAAPTGLSAVNSGNDVVLHWTDNSVDEHLFDVQRTRFDTKTGTWVEWTGWPSDRDTTGFTDTSVPLGIYAYLLRARNPLGPSDWTVTLVMH